MLETSDPNIEVFITFAQHAVLLRMLCIHKQMYVRILHKVMLVRQVRIMYALLFIK